MVNKFAFRISLYLPVNIRFLCCQNRQYRFFGESQSAEDHLLAALDYYSRILQNQYRWWGVAKEPNKSRRFTLFFLQIVVTFSMISEIGITFMS